MKDRIRVALIDDEGAVLDALSIYLRRRNLAVATFSSAEAFLSALDSGREFDCAVSDVRMPGMTGLELQEALSQRRPACPLLLISAHGDVGMAVSALKAGASDFIEKPFNEKRLLAAVEEAAGRHREERAREAEREAIAKRHAALPERQREVLELAVRGRSNKEIAAELGISPRTVEHYREWAMQRMQAESFAELVRMAVRLGLTECKGD